MDKVHQPPPPCKHHGVVLQLDRHAEIFQSKLEAYRCSACLDRTGFYRGIFPTLCELEDGVTRIPAACVQNCIHRANGHRTVQELLVLLQEHEDVFEDMRQRHPGAEPYDPGVMFHVRKKLSEFQEPHDEVQHEEDDESARRQC